MPVPADSSTSIFCRKSSARNATMPSIGDAFSLPLRAFDNRTARRILEAHQGRRSALANLPHTLKRARHPCSLDSH
jgi:hypothetical protein